MKRLTWTSQMLALISLSWCVVVGFWIWFTPVRYVRHYWSSWPTGPAHRCLQSVR